MKLVNVQVENYKSINNSGLVPIEQVTCFVGKNESGKTGFLQALKKFNPIDHTKYDPALDYPKRGYSRYKRIHHEEPASIVNAEFELTPQEMKKVEAEFGEGVLKSNRVLASSNYNNEHNWVVEVDEVAAINHILKVRDVSHEIHNRVSSATNIEELIFLLKADENKPYAAEELLKWLTENFSESLTERIIDEYLEPFVPKFVYFDDYSLMTGKISIQALAERKKKNELTGSDIAFLSLLEIAGLTLDELSVENNYEWIISELESASISISDEIFQFWSQSKQLEVEFSLSQANPKDQAPLNVGTILHIRIRDTQQRVTVPFDERSRGFIWFFSFLCFFSRLEALGDQLILLLDEPALSLHAKTQNDFLKYIDERLAKNYQVIYTTHSPFMIDPLKLDSVRTVEDMGERGTIISTEFNLNDKDTIFPIQAALGYNLAQNLFVAKNCLLVKGPSDLIYLQIMSNLVQSKGKQGLDPRWVIVPVGGADKLATFIPLLGGNKPRTAVIMDISSKYENKINSMLKSGQLENKNLILISEITRTKDADIEDIFERSFYLDLVYNAYASKLSHIDENDLPQTESRIVKQIEDYFKQYNISGGHFNNYRPAAFFIKNQNMLLQDIKHSTLDSFERLFNRINRLLDSY